MAFFYKFTIILRMMIILLFVYETIIRDWFFIMIDFVYTEHNEKFRWFLIFPLLTKGLLRKNGL